MVIDVGYVKLQLLINYPKYKNEKKNGFNGSRI
jgi:hypothetical protein